MPISVGPHDFKPIRFWDRWRKWGRCSACYLPKFTHPIEYWTVARALKDRQSAIIPGGRKRKN